MNKIQFIKPVLYVLPIIGMLMPSVPVLAADNWQIDNNKVYVDNAGYYLSATPATLKGSGWVEFEVRSKGYTGELDLVWGIQDTGEVYFVQPQVWTDNVEHTKTKYVEQEKRLELRLDNVVSASPSEKQSSFNYGNDSAKNDTKVTFTIKDYDEAGKELGSTSKVSVNCDYYSIIGNEVFAVYYDNVEVAEQYKEYYPDYTNLGTDKKISYTEKPIVEANMWTVQSLGYVVAGETYKARCYIEMPFTGLESREYKYAYGVKPSSKTIEQAYLDDSLFLIDPWLDPSWEQRIELTIDHDDVDADLVNFPALIYLSTSSGITSADVSAVFDELAADANRKKIAITTDDEVSQCYVEIELWDDANEQAWLWVNVPDISSTVDTTLYLYYDVDHADNNAYVGDTNDAVAENVWDTNFKAVYHMADGVDNAHIYDSTGNNNDGTKSAANQPLQIAGPIGYAQQFSAAHYIDCGDDASLDFGVSDFTVELIYYGGLWQTTESLVTKKAGRLYRIDAGWAIAKNATNYGCIYTGIADGIANVNFTSTCLAGWSANHIGVTFDRDGTAYTYFNGIETIESNIAAIGSVDNASPLRIGDSLGDTWAGLDSTQRVSYIEEVRLSKTKRSASWIKATNQTMIDDFITYGTEETLTLPTVVTNDLDVDGISATFHGEITDTGYSSADLDDYIGFVWDTTTHVDPGNVAPAISGYANIWTLLGAYGVEAFEHDVTGLTPLVTYYYRACAHNDAGWAYGDEITFFPTEDGEVYLEFRPDLDETIIRGNGGVPTDATVGIYNGYSLPVWDAGANVNEQLSLLMCVPNRWNGDTNIVVHVITALSNANESGNEYQLQLDWEHVTPNLEEVPVTTHTVNYSRAIYSDTQYECYTDYFVIDYDADAGDNIIVDDQIALRLRRITSAGKELTGEVIVLGVHLLFARGDFLHDPTGNVITIINNLINEGSLIGGEDMLFFSCIGFSGFMTWFAARRRNLLLSILAGVCWFGISMWLFFSTTALMDLDESYAQVLVWVFFAMTFVPLVLYMNVPITKTRDGKTWTEYGEPPSERKSEYQKYAEDLHSRMYRHRRRRRLL